MLLALRFCDLQDDVSDELKEAFKVFDRDQDGYISPDEVLFTVGLSLIIPLYSNEFRYAISLYE